ncbi:MAG: sigma-70 family RNA polymerase sigma factor [Defluviitaleaceae bacterium]|nr:sigma-70 family RNA polymerase sigma factor [Defluviitaleaceae bacterium]
MYQLDRGESQPLLDRGEGQPLLGDAEFEKAVRGDVAAFETIVVFYERLVFNIALRMLGSVEDASDITQESFVKLFKNIKSLNDAKHIKSWLCRVAHNLCVDELRKRKNRPSKSLDDIRELEDSVVSQQFQDDAPGPEESLMLQEDLEDLERAVDQLSDEFKVMIVLRDIQGLSYQEISEITGLEMGTVKSRLCRARVRLRQLFLREQSELQIVKSDK